MTIDEVHELQNYADAEFQRRLIEIHEQAPELSVLLDRLMTDPAEFENLERFERQLLIDAGNIVRALMLSGRLHAAAIAFN